MSGYADRLQGTDRVLRIRRIRKAVFAGLLALMLVLIFARMEGEGASIKPLFLPINGIIEVALIIGLIASIVGLLLRNLEIHNVQRDSQRFLMSKLSMTRAIRKAGFAIGLAVALLLAITPSLAASLFSDPPQVVPLQPNGREVVTFTSPDPLGVLFVTHAIVSVTSGAASVTVTRDNVTMTSAWLNATDRIALDIEPTMWSAYATWSLIFRNQAASATNLIFVIEKGVVPTLFSTVPFLLFLYGAAQVGWWVSLRPIRERTKAASLRAAARIGEGERIYHGSAPNYAQAVSVDPGEPDFSVPPPPSPPVTLSPTPSPSPPVPTPRQAPSKPPPRAPVREPDTADSLVVKAGSLVASGAYEAALAVFEDALRLESGHRPALRGKAVCLLRMNRRPVALQTYKSLLAKDPRDLEALHAVARIHAEDRRWRECLDVVDDILRLRPNEAEALDLRGDALTNLGRRPEALAAYEAAAAVDPTDDNVRQKIEEARVDVPGLLSRALIASASGNYAQALTLFDDILEVEPSNVNALIGKAVAYRRSGKPQEALNCLDLVLGVQPNNASALLNRGNILLEGGDADGALEAFDRLTQLYPNDEEAWAAQGEVFLQMGRDDDAMRAYTEALKLSPGDEGIQRHILEFEADRAGEADILQELLKIKGIGQARATALIEAGFKSPEDFAKATLKSLLGVKGITRKIAEDLIEHFKATIAAAR